ncbi:MAG: TlpA family protein disulfide reductase [Bacillota bacterium]
MTQPVALDHDLAISEAFQNEYVPAFYVFDRDGKLRFRAGGDKGLGMVEGRIRRVCGLE